ncbi:MAG: lysine--tRNA ligase, partial [Bacteroidota bacterium]
MSDQTLPEQALSEQERIRREHLAALYEAGIEPYPADEWAVTHRAAEILDTYDDTQHNTEVDGTEPIRVRIAGRMMTKRVMGRASFFHLQDATGPIQVYVKRDDLPEGFYNRVFKKLLDTGDFVGVEGTVFRTRMGEVTIEADAFVLLAKSLRPLPVVKEQVDEEGNVRTYNEVTDKEFRYRQRYVDLAVNPDVRTVFRQRATLLRTLRDELDGRGYVEVETPVLQPLYGGAAARPFTTHHNTLDMPLFLRIADELYLKRLIVGGFEGVYEIAKNFRNEGLSRFHNPEFTMLELYVAYRDYAWMMDLAEQLFEAIAVALHGSTEVPVTNADGTTTTLSFARPWPRRPIFDLIEEYTGKQLRGPDGQVGDRDALASAAKELGLDVDASMGAGKLIDEIFGEFVEPKLIQPTFVTNYPVELSPLAKRHRTEAGLVEHFEGIV